MDSLPDPHEESHYGRLALAIAGIGLVLLALIAWMPDAFEQFSENESAKRLISSLFERQEQTDS